MSKTTIENYIDGTIRLGDAGSKRLAAICAPTLKNCEFVDIIEEGMNGLAVLRVPDGYGVAVHSMGGDREEKDVSRHAGSVIDILVEHARRANIIPLAMADVVDSNTAELSLINTIGNSLAERANHHKIAIMNGENAKLGPMIRYDANVVGTMISMKRIKGNEELFNGVPKIQNINGINYVFFDPKGKPVFISSDGQGTKSEFNIRAGNHADALQDSLEMKWADADKLGATAMVFSDVIESCGKINIGSFADRARMFSMNGSRYIIQFSPSTDRLVPYKVGASVFNISGSLVSVIDEERLKNPLIPKPGDSVIAIRGKPNPRSNGITLRRQIMNEYFGQDWHETATGKLFLEYLSAPSTVLHYAFDPLMKNNLISGFFHMSGGAYNGKLARPLAKNGLFVHIENLFKPDYRDTFFVGATFSTPEEAYEQWPMGTDGFVTTRNPGKTIDTIKSVGYCGREVATVEAAQKERYSRKLHSGVEIVTYNGDVIYFSGIEEKKKR